MLRLEFDTFAADLIKDHNVQGIDSKYQPKPPIQQEHQQKDIQPKHENKTLVGGVTSITQSIEFVASTADIYKALTDIDMLRAWTKGPVIINNEEFSLFDGNITGNFIEMVFYIKNIDTRKTN